MKEFNSDNEEKRLKELLSKSTSEGLLVPENFFEKMEKSIQDQMSTLPSRRTDINPFSVPDEYFISLQSEISERISQQSTKSIFRIPSFLKARILIPISFSLLLAVSGYLYFTKTHTITLENQQLTADDLSSEGYLMDIDEQSLMEFVSDKRTTSHSDSGIEQYLLDNNLDISQLESAL